MIYVNMSEERDMERKIQSIILIFRAPYMKKYFDDGALYKT